MVFEFDNVRNFSHVDIHTNNDFANNIQVSKTKTRVIKTRKMINEE